MFDSTLVGLYAFDPFVLAIMASTGGSKVDLPTDILRLCRLARLSRLVRMLKSLPELLIMIKGMLTAAASVSYTLGLLMIVTYVFAIALTQLSGDTEMREEFFSSVPLSMYSLIIYGTFLDDLAHFCDNIKEESTACLVLVTFFVVLASMTVMNMLIGVLCEVISSVAEMEKESMMQDEVYDRFGKIVEKLDTNGNKLLSWDEFVKISFDPEAVQALEDVKVDPVGMIDFAEDFFFEDGQEQQLSFPDFMNMLLDLRGGQEATLKDVMTLGKRMNKKFHDLKLKSSSIEDKLEKLVRLTKGEKDPAPP
jgi:hypothetical protein